jgi:hypothetical protein
MIIPRLKHYIEKLFARRDKVPNKSEQYLADPEIEKKYGKLRTFIVKTDTYRENFKSLMPTNQERVLRLEEDIRKEYLYEDGPAGGDTHILYDYSHSKGKRESHFLSKKIDSHNRFNYRVYPPGIYNINGKDIYLRKIVLSTCEGHKINGGPDY